MGANSERLEVDLEALSPMGTHRHSHALARSRRISLIPFSPRRGLSRCHKHAINTNNKGGIERDVFPHGASNAFILFCSVLFCSVILFVVQLVQLQRAHTRTRRSWAATVYISMRRASRASALRTRCALGAGRGAAPRARTARTPTGTCPPVCSAPAKRVPLTGSRPLHTAPKKDTLSRRYEYIDRPLRLRGVSRDIEATPSRVAQPQPTDRQRPDGRL
ncbi:hypothetical protein HYPSUDRAFT_215331 [Hypholoma sublateritium FD-334 SS-4]|uniref:Uncharacterized protein n=1 Tax=Hypholoma sublateritium (strain FD-334 SS-4) TaxID=945553 RepID=A0A0D2NWY4_HYPSF|nr:hypothetical protein HYPSUDRAFT_215331 [Hypholoma sublateritium FD-334 SS-4]